MVTFTVRELVEDKWDRFAMELILSALIGMSVGLLVSCLCIAIVIHVPFWWQRRKVVQRRRQIGRRLAEYLDLLDSLSRSGAKVLPKLMPEDTRGWPPENVKDAEDAQQWAKMQWEWHNSRIEDGGK